MKIERRAYRGFTRMIADQESKGLPLIALMTLIRKKNAGIARHRRHPRKSTRKATGKSAGAAKN